MEKRALGRGLSALIPAKETRQTAGAVPSGNILSVPLDKIAAGKYQPRAAFNQERLDELVSSIRSKGVVQPILARVSGEGYELIAGERRLRAARLAGLSEIPTIVMDADDPSSLELALIENIQREDLNPIEEAGAYQRLISDFSFTQERISQVLGKDRATIGNTLRLLMLPKKIQEYITANSITAGHGKALLSLESEQERLRVCTMVMKKGLSVRETETIVAKRLGGRKARRTATVDSNLAALEEGLRRVFGTRVRILQGKKRGKVQIEYYSNEDLDRIIDIVMKKVAA